MYSVRLIKVKFAKNGLLNLGIRKTVAPPTGLEVAQQASSDHKAENMEKLEADIQDKLKLLKFTLGKTDEVLESNSALAINTHHDALNTLVGSIDPLKLQVLEGKSSSLA